MIDTLQASWQRGFYAARAVVMHSNAHRAGERMGAALFCGGKIISTGFNVYGKTHPANKRSTFTGSIHAEHACVIKRQHYDPSNNLIMYVYRETQKKQPVCSKPCNFCQEIMRSAGVKRVRFIDSAGKAAEMKL